MIIQTLNFPNLVSSVRLIFQNYSLSLSLAKSYLPGENWKLSKVKIAAVTDTSIFFTTIKFVSF